MKQIVIYDCEVSTVPKSWLKIPHISAYYKNYHRLPLMNASDHQHLMKRLPTSRKKARPDILHFGLLLALGLATGDDQVVFTIDDKVYEVEPSTRLPRDQKRFYGIIEQLLQRGDSKRIHVLDGPLENHLRENVWAFSKSGQDSLPAAVPDDLTLLFGGQSFAALTPPVDPHKTIKLAENSLELWSAMAIALPYSLGLIDSSSSNQSHL